VFRGPRENGFRSAIDPLCREVPWQPRGRHLPGPRDDGTSGLLATKRSGGTEVVQQPSEAQQPSGAQFPRMPLNALQNVVVDYVVQASEMSVIRRTNRTCNSRDLTLRAHDHLLALVDGRNGEWLEVEQVTRDVPQLAQHFAADRGRHAAQLADCKLQPLLAR